MLSESMLSDDMEANELVCWTHERFEQDKNVVTIYNILFSDDQINPSIANSSLRAGESSGTLQRLLQSLHHVPQRQDAERESTQK